MEELEQSTVEINFKGPLGFTSGAIKSGIKQDKLDLGWLVSKVPAAAAGVYTTNQFQAAPTKLTKATISADQ